ncbi:MAG: ferrous iron transporter C, partial [Pseudomonadales bacterium]
MQQSETLHLLVSSESQAQLEACVGVFRDAGWSARAHRVTSLRDLSDMLRDPQWDLLIASDKHPELAPAEAIATMAKSSNPLPCIVRTASPGNEQG